VPQTRSDSELAIRAMQDFAALLGPTTSKNATPVTPSDSLEPDDDCEGGAAPTTRPITEVTQAGPAAPSTKACRILPGIPGQKPATLFEAATIWDRLSTCRKPRQRPSWAHGFNLSS
jgi:hypothetical protein